MHHEKTDIKVVVIVIPKEGISVHGQSLFWYDTDFPEFDSADNIDYILEKLVSYQEKDGRGHTRASFFWYDTNFSRI